MASESEVDEEEFVQRMSFFNTCSNALTTHLIKRGYQHRFVKEDVEKVRQIPRSKALETSTKQENNRIPFVVTFNPAFLTYVKLFSTT